VLANGNALAIRVNQHFVAVKAISAGRLTRTIDAVSVELPGHDSRDKDVPIMRCAVKYWIELDDSRRLLSVGMIEEDDVDVRSMG
jgi:hypothetical protein